MSDAGSQHRDVQTGRPTLAEIGASAGYLLALAGLIALSRYDYAVFHTLIEAFCAVTAVSVFIVTYHTRRLQSDHYLLFIGIAFMFFAALSAPHALGFKGVQLFPGFDSNLPTQAFIAQRFMLAAPFLIAPVFLRRRLRLLPTFAAFAVVTVVLLLSMFVWRNFPVMFVEGKGLTPLKIAFENVLFLMFLGAAVLLRHKKGSFDPMVMRFLTGALVSFALSELSFAGYADPFGLANLTGHLFQITAFYLTYRAVVETALVAPFSVLFRELSERERELSAANVQLNAVAAISETAISTLDVDSLIGELLRRLVDVMDADAAAVLLAKGNRLEVVASVGYEAAGFFLRVGEGFSGGIALRRQPDFISDARTDHRLISHRIIESGVRSMLGVPLLLAGELIGVLHVDWDEVHPYSESDRRLLEIVGDRFMLALRNAQVYQNEHRIAQVLQDSLLTLPEHVDGLRFATAYDSASEAARVGGDLYDIFELEHGLVGVLVGDVSGKGLEAAVLTSRVKNTIRAHAAERGKTPADILSLTNDIIERSSGSGTFVTVFFGLLDRRDGRLVYCNAGHTAAGLMKADGTVGQLSANSPLVGAMRGMTYENSESHLDTGETLFLYTDGVIEARRDGELYGEGRLFTLLRAVGSTDPQHAVNVVLDDVGRFARGRLSDDLAIFAVQRTGPPESTPVQMKLAVDSAGHPAME